MLRGILLFLLALLPGLTSAQTFTYGPSGGLPDTTETCFALNVTGLPTRADSTFGLSAVQLNITHSYDSDLRITLRAPNGTTVLLVDRRGGGGHNFIGTDLRMDARVLLLNGQAPFSGTFRPEESVNGFNNAQNPNGTWLLCVRDMAAADVGVLNDFRLVFDANPPHDPPPPAAPCSRTNPRGCYCADTTQIVCDLLPDMTASGEIMTQQHTEVPGALSISNATPNIGWGPMEIHGSGQCFCDTVAVACGTICPNGDQPKERVLQTIYRKVRADSIASYTRAAGYMSYHPTHGHVHVDNWGEFSLRLRGAGPDPRTWPIVAAGTKLSFCLINLGDCSANPGFCRDNNGAMLTKADIPNSDFGDVTGCGRDQGIFTGHLDIYDQNLPGMTIDLPNVCNGSYWLVSTTDPNNNFLEADETNNSIAVPITLNRQMAAPTPAFTYSQVNNQFAFNGSGIPAAARFRWNFHDGTPVDSVNNPTVHTFAGGGAHTVTFTVLSQCGTDSLTRTFTALGTVDERTAAHFSLRVVPNPTTGPATLRYALPTNAAGVTVDTYNVLGERVARQQLGAQLAGEQTASLDFGNALPAGIYIVWLRTEKGAQAVRVVKQ